MSKEKNGTVSRKMLSEDEMIAFIVDPKTLYVVADVLQ